MITNNNNYNNNNNNTVRAAFSVVKQRITFYIFHFCTVDKFVTADLQTISYGYASTCL